MALTRRSGQRFEANIWPGFVDAMTALLLVLVFVLSIFMMVQFMLNETITTQDTELDELSGQVASLADALGLEQDRGASLENQLDSARAEADQQAALISALNAQTAAQSSRIATFEEQVAGLLSRQGELQGQIVTLTNQRDAGQAALDEAAANLQDTREALSEAEDGNAGLVARIADIEAGLAREITAKEAAQLALAQARDEISTGEEAARLAAARTDALQALIADLEAESAAQNDALAARQAELTSREDALEQAELDRLADAAAAQALRERLENADAELTAMSLALEEQRQDAEDTLTLLAAANAARDDLDARLLLALTADADAQASQEALRGEVEALELEVARLTTARNVADDGRAALVDRLAAAEAREAALAAELAEVTEGRDLSEAELRRQIVAALAAQRAAEVDASTALSASEQRALLLETANQALTDERAASAESLRRVEALNQQLAALRAQLGSLQGLLDAADARDVEANVQISALGTQLNTALAQVASEQRNLAAEQAARAALEEAERRRLEEEAKELQSYRSEFFGRLRQLLGDQDGVRIEGDRFVFSSEVLFEPASADLSGAGRAEIAKVADLLLRVADDIPEELDWVIRVDGHTDNLPLSGQGEFADNWELSQARALSVVRFMSGSLGIPPGRLAANGFGEFQPINTADTPAARAQNRRIELKLTEK